MKEWMLVTAMENMTDHRFSFYFMGGKLNSQKSVGDNHPTIIEGGMLISGQIFLETISGVH